MSNKYSLWSATVLLAMTSLAQAQSIPPPKSSMVPTGKAQPAAITPVPAATPAPAVARPVAAPLPALVVLPTKSVPAPAKLAKVAKVVPAATTPAVPAKLAVVAAPVVPAAVPAAPQPVPAAKPQAMSVIAAGAVAGRSGAATINEIAANQANALAKAAAIKTTPPPVLAAAPTAQIVPELLAGQAIPVLMTSSTKARTPPPPRPYIAAIIGLKGQEIVEIQPGEGYGYTLRVGDSIQNWTITKIVDSRVHMSTTEYSKKARTTESKTKIVAVGDSL